MEARKSPKPLVAGIIVVLLLAAAGVYVFATQQQAAPHSDQNQADTSTGSADPANEAAPTPSERVAISFTNNGFEPDSVTAKKGTIITVTNTSSRDVQFSSDDHPSHRKNTEMNLKTLSPGESDSYTATAVGSWGFHDHIDDIKTGMVTVTE